ncbi:MAG: hypothetical protein AAGK03_03605 [Pseudomonadota bacterium]
MPVSISPGYASFAGAKGLDHPRIAHAGNWYDATITATTTDGNPIYSTGALQNSLLFERWRPSSGRSFLTLDYGAERWVDYCAIAGDTLKESGCVLRLQAYGAARTNHCIYSEQFQRADWERYDVAVAIDPALAPDGSLSAERIVASGGTDFPNIRQRVFPGGGNLNGRTFTFSVWLWADPGEPDRALVRIFDGATFSNRVEVWVPVTETPTRHHVTMTVPVDWDPASLWVGVSLDQYQPGGISMYAWGAQLEEGPAPTSYVPTYDDVTAESSLHDVTSWLDLGSGSPAFALFPAQRLSRLLVRIDKGRPEIGFIRSGLAMTMETRSRYVGRTPFDLARQVTLTGNRSVRGDFLSRVKLRAGQPLSFAWSHLSEEFAQTEIGAFMRAIEDDVFVIADRPGTHPHDVALCWTEGAVPGPAANGAMDLHDFELTAQGYVNV